MDFTVIKYSGQCSFTVKKWTIDILIFTETHRQRVNDPCIVDYIKTVNNGGLKIFSG